eukprot:9478571-Pyramimonas_sp.AAC.1
MWHHVMPWHALAGYGVLCYAGWYCYAHTRIRGYEMLLWYGVIGSDVVLILNTAVAVTNMR